MNGMTTMAQSVNGKMPGSGAPTTGTAGHSPWWSFLGGLGGARRTRGRGPGMRRSAGEELELRLVLSSSIPANDQSWTFIGPEPIRPSGATTGNSTDLSGTVTSFAVDPTNPNRIFLGSNGGGVWRTLDGGSNWTNQTDFAQSMVTVSGNTDGIQDINGNQLGPEYRTQFVGSITVSKSNPNVIYAGTGSEAYGRDGFAGRGILKSTDGGLNWTMIRGFDVTPNVPPDPFTGFSGYTNDGTFVFDGRGISRIVVDPLDPNIVYVSVMQTVSDPDEQARGGTSRDNGMQNLGNNLGKGGIWKSRDGGLTWENTTVQPQQVINGDVTSQPLSQFYDYTDLVMAPNNPNVMYMAINDNFQGSETGLYRTTDGGVRWYRLSDHPTGQNVSRIRIAISDSNPNIVYSLIVDANANFSPNGGFAYLLMRSTNGGITWQNTGTIPRPNLENFESDFIQYGNGGRYAAAIAVDPNDSDVVWVGGSRLLRSADAGFSWTDQSAGSGAAHLTPIRELRWDRTTAGARLIAAGDGGIRRMSGLDSSGAGIWENLNSTLAIANTVAVDVNRFDENIVYTSNWHTGTLRFNDNTAWGQIDAGDGGTIVVDHSNPNILYRSYRNNVFKSTDAGATWNTVLNNAQLFTTNQGVNVLNFSPLRYAPLVMDPGNSQRLLFATNVIYETIDGGATWRQVNQIPQDWQAPNVFPYRVRSNPAFDYGWDADGRIITMSASTNRDVVYAVTLGEWFNSQPGRSIDPTTYLVPKLFVSTRQISTFDPNYYVWNNITPFLPPSVQGLVPTSMRVDPQDPRTVYLVYNYFSNGSLTGKVIRINNSNTGNPSVLDLTNNLPNTRVWTLEIDPRQFGPLDDIIYIGTDIGVYQAKANQNSLTPWVRFGEDLPYAQVRDLQISKQTNVLYAGTYGRGVWQIRPNATPTLTTVDPSLTTPEDTPLVILYNDLASRANEFDRNGDALSFVVDQVFSGTLEVRIRQGATPAQDVYIPVTPGATRLEFNSSSSAWRWTPAANANNNTNGGAFLAFSVRVTDLELTSSPDVSVFINVTPVNDPPTVAVNPLTLSAGANSIRDYSYLELLALTNPVIGPTPTDITEGNTVSYLISSIGTIPAGISLFRNGSTPLAVGDVIGPNDRIQIRTVGQILGNRITGLFQMRAVDDGTPPATQVTPTVVDLLIQNTSPTLTNVNTTLLPVGTEDVTYNMTFAQLASAANEADVDGDVVSFRITSLAGGTLRRNGSIVTPSAGSPVSFSAGDTLSWTPTPNANTLVNGNQPVLMMTVRAFDGFLQSASDVQVRVNLNPTPDAPIIAPNTTLLGASRNRPFTISYNKLVLETGASDPDNVGGIDPVTLYPLQFVIRGVEPGTQLTINGAQAVIGQLVGPADTLIWTPPAGFSGIAPAFTVELWDGDPTFSSGNFSANTSLVSIETRNDRPLLTSVSLLPGGQEDVPYTIPFATLFNNSDVSDSNSDPLSFRIEGVTSGTLTINGNPVIPGLTLLLPGQQIVWLPPSDANGVLNAFTVSAYDGELASTPPVQVQIAIGALNDAPRFQSNQPFGGGVIENSLRLTFEQIRDTMGIVDVDSPSFTLTINTILAGEVRKNGQLVTPGVTTLGPGESVLYNGPFNSRGQIDAFTITATDGLATSVVATVTVNYRGIRFYRAYNPNAQYHFFTTNRLEFLAGIRGGLSDEASNNTGVAMFLNNEVDTTPVYRLRNPNTGRHYYTANTIEKNALASIGWIYERDENFISTIAKPGLTPVFRLYNASTGTHLYVDSQAQRDAVLTRFPGSWADHGLLGYAIPVGSDNFFSTVPGTTPNTTPTGGGSNNGDRTGPGAVNQPNSGTGGTTTTPPVVRRSTAADQGLVAVAPASAPSSAAATSATSSSTSSQPVQAAATSADVDALWLQLSAGLQTSLDVDVADPLL